LGPLKTLQVLGAGVCLWLGNMPFMQRGFVAGEAKDVRCPHALEENTRIKTEMPMTPGEKQGLK
jgi:hypothetical protein